MAIYLFKYRVVSRSKVKNASGYVSYILRENQFSHAQKDCTYQTAVNFPSWAENNPQEFFAMAEKYERENGRIFSEIVIALPQEFNQEQKEDLLNNFTKQHFTNHYPYIAVIHESVVQGKPYHPHAHIMYSEREMDGIERESELFFRRYNSQSPSQGGAKKEQKWQNKKMLEKLKYSWEKTLNESLSSNGFYQRVSCNNLELKQLEKIKSEAVNIINQVGIKQDLDYLLKSPEKTLVKIHKARQKFNQKQRIARQKFKHQQSSYSKKDYEKALEIIGGRTLAIAKEKFESAENDYQISHTSLLRHKQQWGDSMIK